MKKGFTVRIDDELKKRFDDNYPELLSLFINRCIAFALKSKVNFDTIFFSEV